MDMWCPICGPDILFLNPKCSICHGKGIIQTPETNPEAWPTVTFKGKSCGRLMSDLKDKDIKPEWKIF